MTRRAFARSARRRALRAAIGAMLLVAAVEADASWKHRDTGASGDVAAASRASAHYGRFVNGAVALSRPGETAAPGESAAAGGRALPMTAGSVGPGQTGYVHYFLIGKPDGTSEMQVGLELGDQTIAWSFPGLGVAVSPFIESGTLNVQGGKYEVRHLFGIRPFPDETTMMALARDMPARIMPWIDDNVQHCDLDPPRRTMCVSCLGFVLRVLFPGNFPAQPALPAELKQARAGEYYTTEDLLMYLTGLHRIGTREARLDRINALIVPASLREELIRVVTADVAAQDAIPQASRNRRGGKAKAQRSSAPRPRY